MDKVDKGAGPMLLSSDLIRNEVLWLQARHTTMKMSNKTQKRLSQQAKRGGITTSMIAGTASSLAFTPVQGIELENPSAKAAADRKSGTESYFSDFAGFKSLHTKPK